MGKPVRRPPRREIEKRAYRLAVGTVVAGVGTVVVVVLAILGAGNGGAALPLALLTAGLAYSFKKTVS